MLVKMGLKKEEKSMFSLGGNEGNQNNKSFNPASLVPTFQEEPACAKCCPKLTYQQRLYGFIGCACFGYVLSFTGTLILVGGMTPANIQAFACLYVIGNVIALCATGFLLGPKAQCTKMWAVTRRYSTAFYLTMLIVVFAVAVAKQNVILVLFLLFIEILAGCWYAASYVPFGRKIILAFLRRTCCGPCFEAYDSMAEATKGEKDQGVMGSMGGGKK